MNWKKTFAFVAILGFLGTSLTLGAGRWTQTPPGTPLTVFALDPNNSSTLYAGTS